MLWQQNPFELLLAAVFCAAVCSMFCVVLCSVNKTTAAAAASSGPVASTSNPKVR